ncbi:MAG: hypothetical protein JWO90_1336 [Solirubrobacterales bacterium]|jgi:hypothetical protein|nr:hypothetical protein [Solirubrobacterales bacterium]
MQLGTSLLLLAVGAVLAFAVNASVSGIEINTVGLILMVVGAIGLVLSLLMASTLRGRREVVAERPVVREREVL